MRIMVSRSKEGRHEVTLLPGKRTRMPPVTVSASTKPDLLVEVRKVVDQIHLVAGVNPGTPTPE